MRKHIYIIMCVGVVALMTSCSAHKNTAKSRFWQSFTAKYNTYYNGSEAFKEGNLEKEKGNHDDFTEILPLYAVGNKQSRDLGKANFDRAIEKSEKTIKMHSIKARPQWKKNRTKTARDKEWLARREYNPFIWKAWLLLGKAQFQKGAFDEAAATFSYMSRLYQTQPLQNSLARAWLAKSYTELDWTYDAEDVIRSMSRDSMHHSTVKVWDYTMADYYIHTGDYHQAIPYMKKVISHESRRTQKAREWYLLGQLYAATGNKAEAYRAYGKVVGCNPPYELEFNARIAQTTVTPAGQGRQMIGRLKRMAHNDNNKDYLDQVYYAIGNIFLAEHDTLKAIAAYETGNEKATRSGPEKGVLLLRLGDIYWEREHYDDAQRCYGEAIGLLDKERPDYAELSRRSKVLDELVPHTSAIHLQDSLLQLADMPEAKRLEAIDRVIEQLKKKEREEKRRQQEEEAEKTVQQQSQRNGNMNRTTPSAPTIPSAQTNGQWYFYNPVAVSQGKQTFRRLWGQRDNVDDWQRVNRTVVNLNPDNPDSPDSSEIAEAPEAPETPEAPESTDTSTDSLAADPHNREYYLAQIPFTDEQKEASHYIIKEALLQSGIIFKDKLDGGISAADTRRCLRLSEKQLRRLARTYPDYEQLDLAWYHLFLLYARQGLQQQADECLAQLKANYPESEWTILLSDPYFEENQLLGQHLEDSLYAATYEAFRHDRRQEVAANTMLSASRFPQGDHRAKFLFINGLSLLNSGDGDGCIAELKQVVEKHPDSEVATLAGMIVKGVIDGRRLYGGKFDIGDVWARRDITMTADSTVSDTLSTERNQNYIFLLAYNPDSLSVGTDQSSTSRPYGNGENQLLYEMARYNFTNFLVRNFEIAIDDFPAAADDDSYTATVMRRMMVTGFLSYDEALQYARQLYADKRMADVLRDCRSIIISESNLALLGTRFSYADYEEFYGKELLPMPISQEQLLTIPDSVESQDAEDLAPSGDDEDEDPNAGTADDGDDDDFMAEPLRQPKAVSDFDDDFW